MECSYYCLRYPSREIRLLDLLDPDTAENLRCSIRRGTIGALPPFISVSHVWGQEKSQRLMQLDSGCGIKNVQISRNLESLLHRLLSHESTTLPSLWDGNTRLPMWIDMACINQHDIGEKALQIPLMREIYAQAQSVIIWIHELDESLRYAFRYLRQSLEDESKSEYGKGAGIVFDPLGWDAIRRLLGCAWFQRRWVIQEASIPKEATFLCGTDVMSMSDLFHGLDIISTALVARPKAAKVLYPANIGPVRPVRVLREVRKFYSKDRHPMNLLWMLENLRTTRATLAHDQIYALLGLCSLEEASGNPIRYDLEPEEVYRTNAISHTHLHNDLDFLGLCTSIQRDSLESGPIEALKSRPFAGPSWVPNWHSKYIRRCLGLARPDYEHPFFHASTGIPVDPVFAENELTVSAIFIDKIKVLGDFCHPGRNSELVDPNAKIFEQFVDFFLSPTDSHAPYETETSKLHSFIRTITLLGIYQEYLASPDELIEMFFRWCRGSTLEKQLQERGLTHVFGDTWNPISRFVRMKRLTSWEPFVTEGGYMGLARERCSVGDEIYIIGGSNVPILLSLKQENPSQYEVRGETFLDGFMFGEKVAEASVIQSIKRVTLV